MSFRNAVDKTLKKAYKQENSDLLIHNNGKIARKGGNLFKIEHDFTDGLYLRRMLLNKGVSIISGVHKRDHAWFLLQGNITIASENGVENYSAPYVGFSKAGTQRAIHANELSIFQNVFQNPSNEKNLDLLEDYNYCNTLKEYKEYKKNK